MTRDAQNRFFISVFEKKNLDSVWMSLVPFKKTQFGSDIIVIYYSRNSWVDNLLQILQRQLSHDFDITDATHNIDDK